MPKNPFLDMFGTSPVTPLQEHMEEVVSCIVELVPLFKATLVDDWEKARVVQHRITELEGEADELKRNLRQQLPSGRMMAIDRRDVLEVLHAQDRVANKARDIAGLVIGRQMRFPEPMRDKLREFVRRCIDAVEQAQHAINELDELVETGFQGREVEVVSTMIRSLDSIEGETDKLQVELRNMLFEREHELPPVDVVFMYRVIEWVGEVADLAQRIGSRLELILTR